MAPGGVRALWSSPVLPEFFQFRSLFFYGKRRGGGLAARALPLEEGEAMVLKTPCVF